MRSSSPLFLVVRPESQEEQRGLGGGAGALTGTGGTGALTGTGSTGALTGTGSIGALTGTGSSGLSIAIAISMLVYWTAVVFIHLLSLLPIAVPVAVSPWPPNRFWERTFGSTE